MDYSQRRSKLRDMLRSAGCSSMLVTNTSNVRYLTGFTGEDSFLVISSDEEILISDPRFEQQIGEQCPGMDSWIRQPGELTWDVVCDQLKRRALTDLVVESADLSVERFDQLLEQSSVGRLEKGRVQVEQLRQIKDTHEVQLIRRAVDIAERAFRCVQAQLSEAQTELEIAHELDRLIRKLGGGGCSFPTIVAVGARAALPHAWPGSAQVGTSSFVLIDWGATYQGYCSDLTRVLLNSKIPPKFMEVYGAVHSAQQAAIQAIRPGVLASEIDRVAREVIESFGMGAQFNHGLGHGIGLDVHEAPRLGRNQDRPLEKGMVVTVEPGVYFPGFGGVRIEDDFLVTESGCERLSSLPADLDSNRIEFLR